MERRSDEFSFEGAWAKQFDEEKKKTVVKEQTEVKKHESPTFRGQRDIVENRTEFKMSSNKKTTPIKQSEKTPPVTTESSQKDAMDS